MLMVYGDGKREQMKHFSIVFIRKIVTVLYIDSNEKIFTKLRIFIYFFHEK